MSGHSQIVLIKGARGGGQGVMATPFIKIYEWLQGKSMLQKKEEKYDMYK